MIQQPAQIAISQIKGTGLRVGILVPRYKLQIMNTLITNTYEVLLQKGVAAEDIHIVCVHAMYMMPSFVLVRPQELPWVIAHKIPWHEDFNG